MSEPVSGQTLIDRRQRNQCIGCGQGTVIKPPYLCVACAKGAKS